FTLFIWLAVFFITASTGNVFADYMLGIALCVLAINSVYLLLLAHPLDVFEPRIGRGSVRSRLHWVYTASISLRGVGWTTPAKHIPAPRAHNRTDFVLSTVLRAVRQFILFDAARVYVCYNPVFAAHNPASVSVSITSQGCLLRCASIIAWGAMPYCAFDMAHSLLAVVSVALELSEARAWPPLFGRWKDAYTLRRFWGRTWHQLLRRPLSAIAKSAARSLGFKPGSRGSSYVQLYLVFILSGAVHVGGDAKLNARHTGFSWPFFVLQAMAITLEDAVIGLARHAGFTDATPLAHLVGYLWVCSWFYVSYPVWVDGQLAAGL
ncbi:membrane bound O-acyl transferase family-domain-containing protein, partial [Hygrophoropsis aurantiaca]